MEFKGENIDSIVEKYLDNRASLVERAILDEWLEGDGQLKEWLNECIEHSSPVLAREVRDRLDKRVGDITSPVNDCAEHVPSPGNRTSVLMCVASLAVLILGGIFYISGLDGYRETAPLEVCTHAGDRSIVKLPDGTYVTLNHLSSISYKYNSNDALRELDLCGEAFFDVKTDPEHPFVVECDGFHIVCHGTSFSVKNYPDDENITVVLNDGSITASNGQQSITMTPGTKVKYDKLSHEMQSAKVDVSDYNSWVIGFDRFNDDCLDDILRVVARKYDVRISLITPSLKDVRLSGSMGHQSLDECLNVIASATDTEYIVESDSTICFYRRQQ